ncbi:MAG: hypothetical protein LLG97_13185 [Deltaproteobacteria bacterium]|nr:hypothetical protein [Deltaproteobacteria bacterium]
MRNRDTAELALGPTDLLFWTARKHAADALEPQWPRRIVKSRRTIDPEPRRDSPSGGVCPRDAPPGIRGERSKGGRMMKRLGVVLVFLSIVLVSGCTPLFQKVEKPNTLFDRERYSIVSPEGDEWYLQNTGHEFTRFYRKEASPTHTRYAEARFEEMTAKFENPEKFLVVMKTMGQMWDPKHFSLIEEEAVLDDKFGPYSIRIHNKSEDHRAANRRDVPYLIMSTYGYYILDPNDKATMFTLTYSERGKTGELDPNLAEKAVKFFDGFAIKGRK